MDNLDYYAIGQRIREYRRKKGLTLEAAAELCDITVSFMGNIERGDKKMSLETLAKIASNLSVSTDYLLFGRTSDTNALNTVSIIEQLQKNHKAEQFEKFTEIVQALSTVIDKL